MSSSVGLGGRIAGAVAGVLGLAAAGTAIGVAQRQRVIARRDPEQHRPFGSLRSEPLVVVTDDGVDLHVEVDEVEPGRAMPGTEELTVVFAHGYALNMDAWHFQREFFAGRVRCVYYDQRCHGRSGHGAEEFNHIDTLGRDLVRVIETCAPGPVVVVGHSMGGMSLIALAEQFPELIGTRVVGAALIATTAGDLDPGRILFPMLPLGLGTRIMSPAVSTLDRGHRLVDAGRRFGKDLAEVIADSYAFGDDVPADYVSFLLQMLDATPFAVVADFYPSFATLSKFDAVGVFSRVPTAIVCGTDDKITRITHSRKLHARIHGSDLLELPGAGHMVTLERAHEVNAELEDLLLRVEAEEWE